MQVPSVRLVPATNVAPPGQGHPPKSKLVTNDYRLNAVVTMEQWTQLIGLVADGITPAKAVDGLGINRCTLEGVLRTSPERLSEWQEAQVTAVRRNWTLEEIQNICQAIASGEPVKASCEQFGKNHHAFYRLVLRDNTVRSEYEEALKVRAEGMAEEILFISDDERNDFDLTGKGNSAAVNRSKLRVDARLRMMAYFNQKRFGMDKNSNTVNVQVNVNHALRLEEARARRRKTTKAEPVEEAQFTEVSAVQAEPEWLT